MTGRHFPPWFGEAASAVGASESSPGSSASGLQTRREKEHGESCGRLSGPSHSGIITSGHTPLVSTGPRTPLDARRKRGMYSFTPGGKRSSAVGTAMFMPQTDSYPWFIAEQMKASNSSMSNITQSISRLAIQKQEVVFLSPCWWPRFYCPSLIAGWEMLFSNHHYLVWSFHPRSNPRLLFKHIYDWENVPFIESQS